MTTLTKAEGSRIVSKMQADFVDMAQRTDRGGSDYAYNQRRREEYKASMANEARQLLQEHGYDSFYQGDIETLEMWTTWG